jgi:hypothetical protein
MKSLLPILTFLLGIIPLSTWAQPKTPEEFIAAVREAFQQKSLEKLDALTYPLGTGESDKKQTALLDQNLFKGTEIEETWLEPLPPYFQSVHIWFGKKTEVVPLPKGMIEVRYKPIGNNTYSAGLPYAIINGNYFLTSSRTTDLGWKGPKDKIISFKVIGQGQNKVHIFAKWNASGVEQERYFRYPSEEFIGQYCERLTVTSTEDNTDVALDIFEDGKRIFHSKTLIGKGTIEYKKS